MKLQKKYKVEDLKRKHAWAANSLCIASAKTVKEWVSETVRQVYLYKGTTCIMCTTKIISPFSHYKKVDKS